MFTVIALWFLGCWQPVNQLDVDEHAASPEPGEVAWRAKALQDGGVVFPIFVIFWIKKVGCAARSRPSLRKVALR